MEGAFFWTVAVIASIMVGLSKGGLPVVAMTSVPILSLVMPPLQAAGLLLPIYIVSDAFGLWAYRRDYDLRVLKIMVPSTAIGIFIGWATAAWVSDAVVGGLIGLLGAVFAATRLAGIGVSAAPRPARTGPGLFWGAVAGFTSFVSHAGGPPYQVYVLPLGLTKTVFAGTSTILFAWVNAAKLPAYWSVGMLSWDSLPVAVWLMAPASLAVLAGVRLVRVIPEALFFRIVLWALLLLSLRLIWVAFT
ncbi:sulfite exporter TauE/SafE family protein [Szabonella alba]|uniref:Probable membrane transporter protein n=1 Tax=Szabonella alba TaxID=2804194 RepID=A0A8K0XYE7_9RHOB|nr:sulfite exporter TauE/SafE family protein [Szabonella alba]MBL4915646.1 sulfite exporter TauE/SafE family protein [Szabonella alba]